MGIFAVAMTIPALIDFSLGLPQATAFSHSIIIITIAAGFMVTANRPAGDVQLRNHQAFLLTTLVWSVLCVISALPFYFSGCTPTFIDALFEATSGLTTTGATVIRDLSYASPGTYVWRAMLQWFGGIGIIVMALTVLPMLRVGGVLLYRNEFSDRSEKFLPRLSHVASHLLGIYTSLTFCCACGYYFAGMPLLETVCHSLATVSTGGFSVHNESFRFYQNPVIESISIVFMILGGGSLVLQARAFRGDFSVLRDQQIRGYAKVLFFLVCVAAVPSLYQKDSTIGGGISTLFQLVSMLTTTGYVGTDYESWGGFMKALVWLVMIIGGCTGSTSGSIKIFRYQIIWEHVKGYMRQIIYPRAVVSPKFNGRTIDPAILMSVITFLAAFILIILVATLSVTLAGVDLLTALSGALASVTNVGPGFGGVGPSGNYADLPLYAKVAYSACMLLGRLEFLTIVILLTPAFWEN